LFLKSFLFTLHGFDFILNFLKKLEYGVIIMGLRNPESEDNANKKQPLDSGNNND